MARNGACFLVVAIVLLSVAAVAAGSAVPVLTEIAETEPLGSAATLLNASNSCDTERQLVMCSHFSKVPDRELCCRIHAPVPTTTSNMRVALDPVAVAQSEVLAMARTAKRPDLKQQHPHKGFDAIGDSCFVPVQMPYIAGNGQPVEVTTQFVPQLNTTTIRKVKAAAFYKLSKTSRKAIDRLQWISQISGFSHPSSTAGPAELVLMQRRLKDRQQPQLAAKQALLTGGGVRPKIYTNPENGRRWAPPTDCPPDGYLGPYAVPEVNIDWGGLDAKPASGLTCPGHFDPNAPRRMCGHLTFVELDAVMAYKQALAWWATADDRHAHQAIRIIAAWTRNTSSWGVQHRNGPLEAGWGVAGMARALELLRDQAPPWLIPEFVQWVNTKLMPQMDWFTDEGGLGKMHSNFHAAIAEAMATVAVLSDNRARWAKAKAVFHETVERYLRWGKDIWAVGHVLGECSETQRDLYHSQMGLAGLLQTAELAFQQDEDLYSSNNHALAAAVELHARLIRAALEQNEQLLPQGFKFFESMPKPPPGTFWKFDMETQVWAAHSTKTGLRVRDRWDDGIKYLVGTDFLPAGYELAYNHYSNRLGLKMPETAALLQRVWPDWYELYFGLGTLTHANSASKLWVPGIKAGFKQC